MEEECTERELRALREELGAEKERRERAEREREELRRELEEVRPRGRPWWVVGLLVIVVLTTLVVLSLGLSSQRHRISTLGISVNRGERKGRGPHRDLGAPLAQRSQELSDYTAET